MNALILRGIVKSESNVRDFRDNRRRVNRITVSYTGIDPDTGRTEEYRKGFTLPTKQGWPTPPERIER